MTNHTAALSTGTAPDAAVAELAAAVEKVVSSFSGDIPFGAAAGTLERIQAVHAQVEALTTAMLVPLAQMQASGELLEEGGQKSLQAWMTHAWGLHSGQAGRLDQLATGMHNQTLPETAAALAEGVLTVGEASAIASGVEREVNKRDLKTRPDADEYRSVIETGLVAAKRKHGAMSVDSLGRTAHALGLELNPQRPEKNEAQAFAARGARMRRTFEGTFQFEAWGPASDAERLQAALDSYTAPYDGDAPVAKYARTYDALLAATGFSHGHHGCEAAPGPKAHITITVPLSTLIGVPGGTPATTQDSNVIAASAVRAMVPESQLRRLVFDDQSGLPLDLGRARRLAPGYLRTLAFTGHSTCAWGGGCDVPVSRCEADHITEFSHGGTTSVANLQPLCSTHNRLKYRRSTRHTHTGTTTQAQAHPDTGGTGTGTGTQLGGKSPPPGAKGPPEATGPPGS